MESYKNVSQEEEEEEKKKTADILITSIQRREDAIKGRTFKDICVWSQENIGPAGRNNHSAVIYNKYLILIGGLDGQYTGNYDDLLIYDICKNLWRRLIIKSNHKSSPITRYAHSSFLLNKTLYVFGGFSQKEGCLNDLCKIDLENISIFNSENHESINSSFQSDYNNDDELIVEFQKESISEQGSRDIPCPRSAHSFSIVKTETDQQLWVFGGNSTCDFFNDMYYFSFQQISWNKVQYDQQRSVAIPTPRAGHTMIHFSKPNVFYCFGGGNSYQMFSDLFIFDIETNSWLLPSVQGEGPCARAGHTATKISDNCFIIIGGGDMHFVYNDIFLFNTTLNEWSKLRTAGQLPQKRVGHSASLIDQKIFVFGGGEVDGNIFQDLYSLDLSYLVSTQSDIAKQQLEESQNLQTQVQQQNSRTQRRRNKKRILRAQQNLSLPTQQQKQVNSLKEIKYLKTQLQDQHDYFNKQFKLMINLITDMQNKNEYFFNKYQKEIISIEEKVSSQLNLNASSDNNSDSEQSFNRSASSNSTTDQNI